MAQTPIREEDARALAAKIAAFAESLHDGERDAFEALERNVGMLVATDDIDDAVASGETRNRREALWYGLMTRLNIT